MNDQDSLAASKGISGLKLNRIVHQAAESPKLKGIKEFKLIGVETSIPLSRMK